LDIIKEMMNNISRSLGNQAVVKSGWVSKVKDFETPVVSITTYAHWPNHADVNIWTHSDEKRDKITDIVADSLAHMDKQGVHIDNILRIQFEEEGILQPRKWNVTKNSKPIFRKLIRISLP
jgi:hypothetical protein